MPKCTIAYVFLNAYRHGAADIHFTRMCLVIHPGGRNVAATAHAVRFGVFDDHVNFVRDQVPDVCVVTVVEWNPGLVDALVKDHDRALVGIDCHADRKVGLVSNTWVATTNCRLRGQYDRTFTN